MKERIRRWLFPELDEQLDKIKTFWKELEKAKEGILVHGKKGLVVHGSLVLFGNMTDVKVELKPQIKPEINLSKFELESFINFGGTGHCVTNSYFTGKEATAIKMKS